jgi:hypothetical protein
LARYDDDDDEDRPVMTLDQIFGPVPETVEPPTHYYGLDEFSNKIGNNVSEPSKSQRVRSYLEENPEARNRDIVEALGQYGVTAADVSNAKAHLKRKGETPTGKRGRAASSPTSAAPAANVKAAAAAAQDATGGSIAMGELEAAITFVRQIGSIERAQHLLVIIQQVQKL